MIRKKNISLFAMCLFSLLVIPLLFGCATVPRYMTRDYTSNIKNITVVTKLEDDGLSVLDISGVRREAYSKQYGGVMFGAIGGALEAIIIEGVSSHKINSLIGGSIKPIRESIADFDVRSTFNDIFYKRFSEQIKAQRDIPNVIMLKADDFIEAENGINISSEQKSNYHDTLLKIEYRYGIGAFDEKKPLPAIIANISVISIFENKKIMNDTIITYSCDGNNYTLADYAENNGKIYRQCFGEIVEKFSQRLASVYFYGVIINKN